jgi:hypothetical protein
MKIGELIKHKPSNVLGVVTYVWCDEGGRAGLVEVTWVDGYQGDILVRNVEKVDKK